MPSVLNIIALSQVSTGAGPGEAGLHHPCVRKWKDISITVNKCHFQRKRKVQLFV